MPNASPRCEQRGCVVDTCDPGFRDCNGQEAGCETDINTVANCGQCGAACQAGQVCSGGKCADNCDQGRTNCGGSCVDLNTALTHCGACGKVCPQANNAQRQCMAGNCEITCDAGFANCDNLVGNGCEIDLNLNNANCGACGKKCAGGEVCTAGKCVLTCGGGTVQCGGSCVDLQTEEKHCGDCDKACEAGQTCEAGQCKLNCGGGTIECNDACVDTENDPNNCGVCGKVCAAGEFCQNSACKSTCTTPVPTTVLDEGFADNKKGWGLDTNWAIASTKSSFGHTAGNPDPFSDASPTSDNGVAGVVIGGNVPKSLHSYRYLTSPAVATAGATSLFLEYYRWLNSDFAPYMQNIVEVFDGTGWVKVWETAGSPGISDSSWVKQSIDISAHANANLRVRFGYKIGSTAVFTVSGWNIDDVKLITVKCN